MLKKRLIGVVTVRDGWAVQSMGYRRYLPVGKPECVVENLDRWGADEILVLAIDRSSRKLGPDFALLQKLARMGLSTPLIYSGGIRSAGEGVKVVQMGADRVAVDALLQDTPSEVEDMATRLGAQAVIATLPVSREGQNLTLLDHRKRQASGGLPAALALLARGVVSEALLIDWQNEGSRGGFDATLATLFPLRHVPLILFGGITEPGQIRPLLQHDHVAAVAMGNTLNYREHAVQQIKAALDAMPVRHPVFESADGAFLNV